MKLLENIVSWLILGFIIGGLIWLIPFLGMDKNIGVDTFLVISFISSGIICYKTSGSIVRDVGANKVSTGIDPLGPEVMDASGKTKFKEYHTGTPISPWWETSAEDISIAKDIVNPFKYQVTIADDEITVSGVWACSIDPNEISLYLSQGDSETERIDNVTKQIDAMVTYIVETKLKPRTTKEITDDLNKPENLDANGRNVLDQLIIESEILVRTFCSGIGLILNRIQIANIDPSTDVAEARKTIGEIRTQEVLVQEMLSDNPEMTVEAARSHIRVMSDASQGFELTINTAPDFSGTIILPQNMSNESRNNNNNGGS
jgi:hypothetical protein